LGLTAFPNADYLLLLRIHGFLHCGLRYTVDRFSTNDAWHVDSCTLAMLSGLSCVIRIASHKIGKLSGINSVLQQLHLVDIFVFAVL
jgi:hypothetical protein